FWSAPEDSVASEPEAKRGGIRSRKFALASLRARSRPKLEIRSNCVDLPLGRSDPVTGGVTRLSRAVLAAPLHGSGEPWYGFTARCKTRCFWIMRRGGTEERSYSPSNVRDRRRSTARESRATGSLTA